MSESPARGPWKRAAPVLLLLVSIGPAACGGIVTGGPPSPSPDSGGADRAAEARESTLEVRRASVTFTVVADSVPPDPEMEALVSPYRAGMEERTGEIIGRAGVLLAKAQPEGTLGNFAADAMLRAARERVEEPVHMALTNNGGLRVPIPPGPITMGQMFELMPFENRLSILVLSGSQVEELARQVAGVGGEPIAGFSFRIHRGAEGRTARDVTVGGRPVEPDARYRLVTNDYLASGGGTLTPLHHPLERRDLPVLLRDVLVEYVREAGVVEPEIEGRIKGGIGS